MDAAAANRLLSIATAEIGYTEWPPGSNLNKYAAELGHWNGSAWCAIFVTWCFRHAGLPLPDPEVFNDGGMFTYCPAAVNYARANGQAVDKAAAQPGDIVLYDWDGGVADHVGIIESVTAAGPVAIEGNTAIGNNSNGGQVMRRTDRKWSQVVCVWRPPITASPATTAAPEEPEVFAFTPLWATVVGGATPHYRLVKGPFGWLLQGFGECQFPGAATPDANGMSSIALGPENADLSGAGMSPHGDYVHVYRMDGHTLDFPTGSTNPVPAPAAPSGVAAAVVAAALEHAAQDLRAA